MLSPRGWGCLTNGKIADDGAIRVEVRSELDGLSGKRVTTPTSALEGRTAGLRPGDAVNIKGGLYG